MKSALGVLDENAYIERMELANGFDGRARDWMLRYTPLLAIALIAFICAQVGSYALYLPMHGIEHGPSIGTVLLHVFSHNSPGHFLGNYLGLFLYAVLFGVACRRIDMRSSNSIFLGGLTASVVLSIGLALFVVPNDNGVTGISGVVKFLMGYFWVGCAPALLTSYPINRKRMSLIRLQRRSRSRPMFLAVAFFIGTLLAHGLMDGFASLNPLGDNAIGNLYHLVGYVVGCLMGLLMAVKIRERTRLGGQFGPLRQSQGI